MLPCRLGLLQLVSEVVFVLFWSFLAIILQAGNTVIVVSIIHSWDLSSLLAGMRMIIWVAWVALVRRTPAEVCRSILREIRLEFLRILVRANVGLN